MLQALLVTFREGLESFLIIGVIAAYLRKTGRGDLIRGVRIGFAVSIVTCLIGAYLWQLVPNQPLYEGIAALTAAALVGIFLIQMLRLGRHMKSDIEARVARVAASGTIGATTISETSPSGSERATPSHTLPPRRGVLAGIALVTALFVTREGLEAVLYLGIQVRMAGTSAGSLLGAALGLVLACAVAWIWFHYANRLNLGIVLKVTAIFLALFLFQLLVYGVHELAESGIIEGTEGLHDATEAFGPQGPIGHVLSYALLAAPVLYLILSRRAAATRATTAAARRPPAPA